MYHITTSAHPSKPSENCWRQWALFCAFSSSCFGDRFLGRKNRKENIWCPKWEPKSGPKSGTEPGQFVCFFGAILMSKGRVPVSHGVRWVKVGLELTGRQLETKGWRHMYFNLFCFEPRVYTILSAWTRPVLGSKNWARHCAQPFHNFRHGSGFC